MTRQALTLRLARNFAEPDRRLRECGHGPQTMAHCVNRMVFCLFADDVGLRLDQLLSAMLIFATMAVTKYLSRRSADSAPVMAVAARRGAVNTA